MAALEVELSTDRFLGGKLTLAQPRHGYRAGADAILLAASLEAAPKARVMEAGCGIGAALLTAALRLPEATLLGVERQDWAAKLARDNIERNGLERRVKVVSGDALRLPAEIGVFDGIFVNPPYADESSPDPAPKNETRRAAFVSEHGIDIWVRALADKLRGGAALTMIHKAEALAEILASLQGRLGGVEVLPIRPRAGAPAHRVLVRARKGVRAPLKLLNGLNLHDDSGGKFTAAAEAIFLGEARVEWR